MCTNSNIIGAGTLVPSSNIATNGTEVPTPERKNGTEVPAPRGVKVNGIEVPTPYILQELKESIQ